MKKGLIAWIITAVCLLLTGGIIFVVAFGSAGWKFSAFTSVVVQTETYEEKEDSPISTLVIDFETADILVKEGDALSVEYPLIKNRRGKAMNQVTVQDENGTLSVSDEYTSWGHIGIWGFSDIILTVTIPKGRVLTLDWETDTGDITFAKGEYAFTTIDIETDTGDIQTGAATLVCETEALFTTNTGDVDAENITAQKIIVDTDTGDVELQNCVAAQAIFIETSTGDVELSGSVVAPTVNVETDTGDVSTDECVLEAESVTFTTDTGDVEITLAGAASDYTITVETDTGRSNLSSGGNGSKKLSITTDTGDIQVRFA